MTVNILDLKVYTPTKLILDEDVKKLKLKGREGNITFLPNHIDYISSFNSNIITYINEYDIKKYIMVDDGILIKYSNRIRITTNKAVVGNSIEEVKNKMNNITSENEEIKGEITQNLEQLEYYLFNDLVKLK